MPELSDRQAEVLAALTDGPTTRTEIANALDVAPTTVSDHFAALREAGIELHTERDGNQVTFSLASTPDAIDTTDDESDALPDLSDTPVADTDPTTNDLTNRERVLVSELETGATLDELTDRLDERESIVTEHLRDLRRSGWRVYIDETAAHVGIESDHPLRSSEHKGTRTRKANQWWELSHNALVRGYRALNPPTASLNATDGSEDWLLHMTDLHAGDLVRDDEGNVVYSTDQLPSIIDYITERGEYCKQRNKEIISALREKGW